MVDRHNASDPTFAKFSADYLCEDVRRDLNAEDQAIRDTVLDFFDGEPFIAEGLLLANGTIVDTVKVLPGRARDYNGRHIVVPIAVDNIAVDNTGLWNYIAIRHTWAYDDPDAAVKTGLAYNRVRSDWYEIVAETVGGPHAESEGWIRLGRARKVVVWEYDYERYEAAGLNYPRTNSGGGGIPGTSAERLSMGSAAFMFTYFGSPVAGVLMNRHDITGGPPGLPTGDLHAIPFDFLVCRVDVRVNVAAALDTTIDLWQNGAVHANWVPGELTLAAADTTAGWFNPYGIGIANLPIQYYAGDLIQVELNSAGLPYPTDISVTISGINTGNV